MDTDTPRGYTVKQAAALTGTLETTLRVWEKRYGIVSPQRTETGYRVYSDADLARLRTMAALVADGVPARTAARHVLDEPTLDPTPPNAPDADLVAAAASLDPDLLDRTLERGFAWGTLEQAVEDWLLPELDRLGHAWAAGEVSVAAEHFASAGVVRALGVQFQAARPQRRQPVVLVGLPPGARHELGLLAFAVFLRRLGLDAVYLGADVPLADWIAAAETLLPRAAVIAATRGSEVGPAQEVVDALTGLHPPVAAWVGGGQAASVTGAQRLPHSVVSAARQVSTALRAGVA